MRCAERAADLDRDVKRTLLGHAVDAVDRVDEVEPVEALHDEIGRTVRQLAEVADVDDVLVPDVGGALGFAPEPRQHLRVARVLLAKDLHRERLVQARMGDPVHEAHASFAEQGLDAVALIDRLTEQPFGRSSRPRSAHAPDRARYGSRAIAHTAMP